MHTPLFQRRADLKHLAPEQREAWVANSDVSVSLPLNKPTTREQIWARYRQIPMALLRGPRLDRADVNTAIDTLTNFGLLVPA